MSSSPSLKITLKLKPPTPQLTDNNSRPGSPLAKTSREDSSQEIPRKRARPTSTNGNSGRSRKPKTESTPVPDTPLTVDDDTSSVAADEGVTPSSNSVRRGGGGGGGGGGVQLNTFGTNAISRKELLKHKDIHARKWTSKPLVFYTLNGSEIQLSSWQSDEKMNINKAATEPITVAEIDQLFSSTAGEKDFRPFLCTQPGCSKAFTTFDQLQTHETNMHGTKKLVCGIDGCNKSFVTPGQLTKHRKMVHFRAARKAKLEKDKEEEESKVAA